MSTEEFHKLPVISANYYPIITGKMDRIVKIGLEKQTDSEILSISSRCIDDILKTKYGHEKIINEQMVSELSNHLATEFVKFIYRDLK